jgi:Fic family protein
VVNLLTLQINKNKKMELQDKIEQWRSMQPLSEMDTLRLQNKFMLDFNYNSNHIEGNTLTYGQTEVLLLFGEVIGNAPMRDFEEMKAHNLCLNIMIDEALSGRPLTEAFIRQLHKVMLREDYEVPVKSPSGVITSYTVHAGIYKTRPNSVKTPAGTMFYYATPEETPAFMSDLVQWYNDAVVSNEYSPIELAAIFHYRYIRIHPFEDGNGRIARLLVNFILKQHGWPMLVVKTKNKASYLTALAQADANVGPVPSDGAHADYNAIVPFVEHMKKILLSDVSDYISFVSTDKDLSWWYDGVIVKFSTDTPGKILSLLQSDPNMTLDNMAKTLGINRSAIQKQINTLADKKYISRPEGKKRGWIVNAKNTISYGRGFRK